MLSLVEKTFTDKSKFAKFDIQSQSRGFKPKAAIYRSFLKLMGTAFTTNMTTTPLEFATIDYESRFTSIMANMLFVMLGFIVYDLFSMFLLQCYDDIFSKSYALC